MVQNNVFVNDFLFSKKENRLYFPTSFVLCLEITFKARRPFVEPFGEIYICCRTPNVILFTIVGQKKVIFMNMSD